MIPVIFRIERIDGNGKADCAYYGSGIIDNYEQEISNLLDKVLNMVSA